MSSIEHNASGRDGLAERVLAGHRRMVGGRRGLAVALAGLYLLLLAAPVALLIREDGVQEEVRQYLGGEDRWTLYRAEVEYITLVDLLHRAAAGEPEANRNAVQTGIDLLYSRREVLNAGNSMRIFSSLDAYDDTLAAMSAAIADADAVLASESGPSLSAAGLGTIRAAVARIQEPLQSLIRDALVDSARRRDELSQRADQQILWLRVVTGALIAASLVYIGGLVWNVARLRRSGDELHRLAVAVHQSEGRLRLIADNLPMLIGYLDTGGCILFINRTGERWAAAGAAEIIGGNISTLFAAESYALVSACVDRAIAGGVAKFEDSLTFPDGSQRFVEASFIPDFIEGANDVAEDRRVRGFFMAIIDVSARKESEEQLRQALKMEAVGRLTGGVAHDFNNLLGVIVGNLDLAALELADRPRERLMIERAIGAAERGASLTQRLLAFSRKQTLLPRLTDVNRLVVDMSDMLVRTLGETIEVGPVLCREPCFSRIDPNQLEAAILNLAVNARDAMPEGGRLTIATMTIDAADAAHFAELGPSDYVTISVSDTGMGMASDVAKRAFEPFYTTKEVGKGSGLGLSMVFGFVKQSGGHVEIESESGFGTTVRLYLPRSFDKTGGSGSSVEGPSPGAGKGRLVLVVEDNRDMLAFSITALNRLGYRTAQAENAADALDVLERLPEVSVLFTDIMLPGGMDGVMLADEARRRRPDLKVLFTSGFAEREAQNLGREMPLPPEAEMMGKPFRVSELSWYLDRVLAVETV